MKPVVRSTGRTSEVQSDADQLYVKTGCICQRSEVGRIAGEDLVAVMGKEDDRGVDDVITAGSSEK